MKSGGKEKIRKPKIVSEAIMLKGIENDKNRSQ